MKAAGTQATRTEKALHRANWVKRQKSGARQQIGEMLLEIYAHAYQQSNERPLDLIASDTIEALLE